MSTEFTGERVIPGLVDVDLWNEHISRYTFAARLARRKRVLDVGCGAGYGTAELAQTAREATGLDVSVEAVEYAQTHYERVNVPFEVGSATEMPFADASFDLVVAFEVIEHLENWQQLLTEARRVLAPGGQLVVSTPNKLYYAESREQSGPNPFHTHEFEIEEFRGALGEVFPHVSMFLENHADSIVFQPEAGASGAEVKMEGRVGTAADAHFFLAVCANEMQTGAPAYLYVPSSANVLREREQHIGRLTAELATKDGWIVREQTAHQELLRLHDGTVGELKAANGWAQTVNANLKLAHARIEELQEEIEKQQRLGREAVAGYEAEIARIEEERGAAIAWGQAKEEEWSGALSAARGEYEACLQRAEAAEALMEERTVWAQGLDREIAALREHLATVGASKWMRLGRRFGVGPTV